MPAGARHQREQQFGEAGGGSGRLATARLTAEAVLSFALEQTKLNGVWDTVGDRTPRVQGPTTVHNRAPIRQRTEPQARAITLFLLCSYGLKGLKKERKDP